MSNNYRRTSQPQKIKISIIFFRLILLFILLFLIFTFVKIANTKIIIQKPIPTLKERLLVFINDEDLVIKNQDSENINIYWKDIMIKVGSTENIVNKVDYLSYLLPIIQDRYQKIDYVDLRWLENVVIKYRGE